MSDRLAEIGQRIETVRQLGAVVNAMQGIAAQRAHQARALLPAVRRYTLMKVERGVPEVFNSTYDIRTLLATIGPLRDGKGIDIPGPSFLRKLLMKKLEGTEIAQLLEEFHLLSR